MVIKMHPKIIGIIVLLILPILCLILYYLSPAPFVPELISPQNNSSMEISPHTQLIWVGGTQNSVLSKIISFLISFINQDPSGNIEMTYNVYIGQKNYPLITEGNIDLFQENEKQQIACNLPDSVKDNSTYYWKVISHNNLGKKTEGPIWIFNTTFLNLPPTIINLTSEPDSPQAPGAIITWTVNASDPNNDPIYYKFFLNGKEMTHWISSNKWNWETSDWNSGNNSIRVLIRDKKHADENSSDDQRDERFVISSKHKILEIQSNDKFSITNIWDKNNKELKEGDEFFYLQWGTITPITVRGKTQYGTNAKIWIVLTDAYNNYYLQNPALFINPTKSWRATNIRPLRDIVLISFVKVDEIGDELFKEKVNKGEWGGFKAEDIPPNSEIVGSIEIL